MGEEIKLKQQGYGGKFTIEWLGDVALLTIDCDQNRMNDYFIENFNKALDEVLRNPKAKALITTGKGKFYSNGIDLDWLQLLPARDPEHMQKFVSDIGALWMRMLLLPIPTVAAINGHAFAGGAVLAICHDYCVMNPSRGWLSLNEVHIGLRFNAVSMAIAKTRLPHGPVFHQTAVMGARYTAQEALKLKLIHRISSTPETLLPDTLDFLKEKLPAQGYKRDFLGAAKCDAYKELIEIEKENAFVPSKL